MGIIPTGTIQSALSQKELRRIVAAHASVVLEELPTSDYGIQIALGNIVKVRKQVLLRFFLAGRIIEEHFMVLPTMGNILIGMSFLAKYSFTLDLKNTLVQFLDLSLQLRLKQEKFKCEPFEFKKTTQNEVVGPLQQVMVPTIATNEIETSTGITEATTSFSQKVDLIVTAALIQLQINRTTNQVKNPNAHTFTICQRTLVANFKILTTGQASHVHPMSLEQLNLIYSHINEATNGINQLFQPPEVPTTDRRWYPTPETCEDPPI